MRIAVMTRNNVRVMLDITQVRSQRKIIAGFDHYFQVTLITGGIVDLISPLSDIPMEPEIDITSKLSGFVKRIEKNAK